MSSIPQPLHDAAAAFDRLPGVGPRASLRYAYWLVTQSKEDIQRFAKNIEKLAEGIARCPTCYQWSDTAPCFICRDPGRDATVLCVVATSQHLNSIEETGIFKGRYHVLGGTLDPIEGRTPDQLQILSLVSRLKDAASVKEVILAFDADLQGDTTVLYLRKQLSNLPLRITRLARGLPMGASLEYADAYTLTDALKNRKET